MIRAEDKNLKPRTVVVAWINILIPLLTAFTIVLFADMGGQAKTDFLQIAKPVLWWMEAVLGINVDLIQKAWLGFTAATSILWIFLMHRQRWAWWILVVVSAVGTAFPLLHWINYSYPEIRKDVLANIPYGILFYGPTLVFLLTDRPVSWKRRSTGSSRRRKSKRATKHPAP
jgi:hypothetical protein